MRMTSGKIRYCGLAVATALALPLVSARAQAAPAPLTIDAALGEAKAKSPELKRAELAAEGASWRKLEALSGHLPQLGAHMTQYVGAKYPRLGVNFDGAAVEFPSAFPQTNIELEASLVLFDGLGTINRYRAASLSHEAAELEASRAKFRLEEAVQLRFYQALGALKLAAVADQNIKTLEDHLSLVRASERAGMGTKVDVLRIESLLEEARAEKLLAEDNVSIARRALFEAMGVPEDDRGLEGALEVPDPRRVKADLAFDPSRREDLQAETKREQASDRLNAAAAAFWVPKISVFATELLYKYGTFDPAVIPNSSLQEAYSVGFKLSWNLFDGGASIARKAQADVVARQAVETTRQQEIHAPNEFANWKRRYVYNAALYQARQRSVEKSQESVRLANLAVKAGTKTNSEFLDAELELFRARAGAVRAQLDAAEALSNLELALGRRL